MLQSSPGQTTGAFSWNVGKLFSELKLVKDNLLFIYAEANWEATEKIYPLFFYFSNKGKVESICR